MSSVSLSLARQQTNFSQRLPQGWGQSMSHADKEWFGKAMFVAKGKMTPNLKTWWHPPAIDHGSTMPSPGTYFRRRLFLWMPRKMWAINLVCVRCCQALQSKGAYNKVRVVINVKDCYYLAEEYMYSSNTNCTCTYISWDKRILDQLPDGVRARFPVVLMYKYACNRAVVSLLCARTLGNSPTALRQNIFKVYTQRGVAREAADVPQ